MEELPGKIKIELPGEAKELPNPNKIFKMNCF